MRFFISYAGEDEKWARWIVWELKNAKQHYECIVQFLDFAPGMSFIDRMRKAAEAECTIALFSPAYFSSRYCQDELNAALAGKPHQLLPVRLERCNPGAYLRDRIYIDLVSKSLDQSRRSLLSGVEAYVSQTVRDDHHTFTERPDFPGQVNARPAPMATPIAPSGPLQVLFMAPEVGGLSPKEQLDEMQGAVGRVQKGHVIHFHPAFDARVHTLFEELNRRAPDVFHFSGKQNGGDILMRTEDGGLTSVPDTALAGMFQSLDRGVRLVIIDTCYSLRAATTIATVVPCAIGVEGAPYEADTVEFFSIFYQAIAAGRSIKDAVGQAQTSLKITRVAADCIPQLRCGPGIDPAEIFLVPRIDPQPKRKRPINTIRRSRRK